MQILLNWLKELLCCLCFMTILLHVIPDNSLKRYVRFFLGLVFLLVVLHPLEQFFVKDSFLKQYELESLRERINAYEAEEMGLKELFPDWNETQYRQQLQDKLRELEQIAGHEGSQSEQKGQP